jgi:protein KTI12
MLGFSVCQIENNQFFSSNFVHFNHSKKMPLIIICGIPSSGKTTRAKELEKYFREECGKVTHLINEEYLLINKAEGYKDNLSEKNTRAALKAAVDRFLNKDVVVIFDSLNYIKGYRYEVYCSSRALRTPHCVVHCDVDLETAKEWNEKREEKLDPTLLVDLAGRFETPNGKNRWDSPLFTLTPETAIPFDQISEALFKRTPKPPNIATLPQVLSDTNFLYELDKTTQEIVAALLQAQNTCMIGDSIPVPKATTKVRLVRKATMSELRRLQRQFLKITQMHPPTVEEIGNVFVDYINTNLAS